MRANVWQLQEAKNKFSKLVERALHDGPQIVTKHGKEAVVVLPFEDYRKMTAPTSDLVDFFQQSPLSEAGIDLAALRSKDLPRDTRL